MKAIILYFHGFASSSKSDKVEILKKFFSNEITKAKIIAPDLSNNFSETISQIEKLIEKYSKFEIGLMGSSLGGYYASYFATKLKAKAVLINPAIYPLEGFEIYLGKNKNFSTGEEFYITDEDIKYLRTISYKEYKNQRNTLILLESNDEVLSYKKTCSYYYGSYFDITFGGDHSYTSLSKKLNKIKNFLNI